MFDNNLKRLARGKTPRPDNIPNVILKALHPSFHDMLSSSNATTKKIYPDIGNIVKQYSSTKRDPLLLTNYKPIALANIIYKLYTSIFTVLLKSYGEKYKIIYFGQEGFILQRNITKQIQMMIAALENARLINNDIYLTYIDFRNAFRFIDHARFLALMEDFEYLQDTITSQG